MTPAFIGWRYVGTHLIPIFTDSAFLPLQVQRADRPGRFGSPSRLGRSLHNPPHHAAVDNA